MLHCPLFFVLLFDAIAREILYILHLIYTPIIPRRYELCSSSPWILLLLICIYKNAVTGAINFQLQKMVPLH